LIITPHPGVSQLYERLAGDAPLFDDSACARYATWGREQLDLRLEREAAGP
jgi:metallo-beta-lactamase class B